MSSLTLRAPAKINPVLEVLGRRADGFHDLALLFQAVALYDEVSVAPAASGVQLTLDPETPGLPADDSNLAVQAARLFLKEALQDKGGVRLGLRKNIPLAAGLGGGSSDAAAVLWGMNEAFQAGLSLDALRAMGARLGSDVPFFLSGGFALGTGRGEVITPLPPGPSLSLVLAKPPGGLSTPSVYKSGKAVFTSGEKARHFPPLWQKGNPFEIGRHLFNGLEAYAYSLRPEIAEIKESLTRAGACGALVSGSGPTVFGLAASEEEARRIGEKVQRPDWTVVVTRTVSTGIEKK